MALRIMIPVNLSQNELQKAVLENLSTAPASPVSGQLYFDTTLDFARFFDGTAWVNIGGTDITLSGTEPEGQSDSDVWYEDITDSEDGDG